MNSRRIGLLLMVVNLGLLVMLAYMVFTIKPGSSSGMTGTVRTETVPTVVTQIAVRKINSTNNLLAALAGRPLNWRALESTNYVVFIENLAAFGCPEETIRDIIITDVAKLFARRRAELRGAYKPYEFWKTYDPLGGPPLPPELQLKLRALDKEQRQLIRELLGVDLKTELARYSGDSDGPQQDYSFLPPDKQEQVRGLTERYEEMEQDLYTRTRGWLLEGDLEQLKQLQQQRRAELAALLSPEEMEDYELRHSDTANNMRSQMSGFQPSEEEFRKIFRLQRTFDLQFDQAFDERDESAQAAKARAQQQAQDALAAELQKTLGPQRFAEYQRAQDGDYRSLLQLGERFGMDGGVANQVYNMKLAAEMYKYRVESNPNITDEQRARAVADLARETERSVAAALGEDAYKAYLGNGGRWLDGLQVTDENVVPAPPPQQSGTTLPYDVNQLPPLLRSYILNPFPQPIPPIQPVK